VPRNRVPVPPYRPQLALLVKQPPEGDGWIHEVKLDGYRIGCRIEGGEVALLSRRDNAWTASFPSVVAAAARLGTRAALLDGELAAVLPDGRTSMHAMGGGGPIAYFVFDILHLDGADLTALPLDERKVRLRALLGKRPPAPFRYVDHVVGGGAAFLAQACRLGIEGIVSKQRDAPYRPAARNATWQKSKCVLRQEFVIGGYEDSTVGSLGALWLGYHDTAGRLVFAGKVGTGFQRDASELLATFRKMVIARPAFDVGLPTGYKVRDARWLEPRLVCEVAFMEWTHHGHIRHGSYQGMRPDKRARDVIREAPAPAPHAASASGSEDDDAG
jgi:bifunctional non-homologous end joining protein LigD